MASTSHVLGGGTIQCLAGVTSLNRVARKASVENAFSGRFEWNGLGQMSSQS